MGAEYGPIALVTPKYFGVKGFILTAYCGGTPFPNFVGTKTSTKIS